MSPAPAGATAERAGGAVPYQRHRPEYTLLYQIVEQYYPAFVALMAEQERPLPDYVQREFELSALRAPGAWLFAGALRQLPR